MGRRRYKNLKSYIYFTGLWPSIGLGKFWKRKLSKARRKAWKNERHTRGLSAIESTVNYKTW